MKDAGITAPVPRGDWQGNVNYYFLNIVNHNGISWIAKRENLGQEPSDGLYWQRFGTSVPIASTSVAGIVKPDGETIKVDANGKIEVNIDGQSIYIDDEDGKIKASLATLADVDITDLEDGYVLAWDATSETWVAVRQSSGLLPHLIIISETGESVVKAVKGQTEVIATETSTGHYECDVPEFGTWTIHAVLNGDDATVNLVVDTVKVYTVADSHFHADITVTYPTGAQVSCSKSGETTLYATGSPYTFTVHSAGTWTITCEVDGKTYTQVVNVTTTGQTFSYTLPVGSTVTPTDDVTTLLHCAGIGGSSISTLAELFEDSTSLLAVTSSHNAVDYLVRSKTFTTKNGLVPVMTGYTTPSGIVSINFTDQTSLTNAHAYNAFDGDDTVYGMSLPDNSSSVASFIEYTFDNPVCVKRFHLVIKPNTGHTRIAATYKIQASNDDSTWTDFYEGTWTAGTTQTTDIDEVINNSTEYKYYRIWFNNATHTYTYQGNTKYYTYVNLLELFASETTQQSVGFCDNQTAMTDIGVDNYCADTLLADDIWSSAICNSTYFENVLNYKIPTMTNNTTPSGICSATNVYYANSEYQAFDSNTSTAVLSAENASTPWDVIYEFANDIFKPKKIRYTFKSMYTVGTSNITIDIYDSQNNAWTTLKTRTGAISGSSSTLIEETLNVLPTGTRFSKIRFRINTATGGQNRGVYGIQPCLIQIWGRAS